MRALDLCCGKGGWARALIAAGFEVEGVDLEPQPDFPGSFTLADVRTYRATAGRFDVVVASPPCTKFSLAGRWKGNLPGPLDFEVLAHVLRIVQEAQPRFWAVENVQGAVAYFRPLLGQPRKYGSWFLWGDFPRFRTGPLPNKGWDRHGRAQRGPRDPALRSIIPGALAEPFARACADALKALRSSAKGGDEA